MDSTDGHLKLAVSTHVSLQLSYCSIYLFFIKKCSKVHCKPTSYKRQEHEVLCA